MKCRWRIVLVGAVMAANADRALAQQDPLGIAHMAAPEVKTSEDAPAREPARRQELTQSILAARQAASGRRFSERLRASMADKLALLTPDQLEGLANAGALGDIDALVRETVGPRALGDTDADLVFTPVSPCRIVNTTVTGSPIPANATRSFFVNGSAAGTFESQGGTAGGCGIPDDATSVEMNFIAVGPTGSGDFRAFPFGSAAPLASVINYANVGGLNIANGLAQPVCDPSATTCALDLTVQADVSASHLIVDVVGYYRRVNKAQVKSFVATSAFGPSTGTFASTTCGNTGAIQVVVNAPAGVSGKVLVQGRATYLLNHVAGTADIIVADVATDPTTCSITDGYTTLVRFPASPANETTIALSGSPSRVFDVAAGSTTTFYLNSWITSGTNHRLYVASLVATFIPD